MDGEVGLDRSHQTARQFLLVRPLRQQAFFLRVRQTAEFDEGGRDVWCCQNDKIGRAPRMIEQDDFARE
jgi:hypothetical protein